MYRAAVDVRRALHKQGLLSTRQLYAAQAMGFLRHLRRRVLAMLRNRPGKRQDHLR
jgi:hypothetical protein